MCLHSYIFRFLLDISVKMCYNESIFKTKESIMKFLFFGDIVGEAGVSHVQQNMARLRDRYRPDFILANGENAAPYNGITPKIAEELRFMGVDVITLGNHAFNQRNIIPYLEDCDFIVRPANLPRNAPGQGYATVKTPYGDVCVIAMMGQIGFNTDNPYDTVNRIMDREKADYYVVDFHADMTSEKCAMGYYLDGRASAVIGTHTHIQTADARFLPKGTAYITDVGMCGAQESILGVTPEPILERFTTGVNAHMIQSTEPQMINALFFDTENRRIERIYDVEGVSV